MTAVQVPAAWTPCDMRRMSGQAAMNGMPT